MYLDDRFSSGLELAHFVVSSDLLKHSWAAIWDLYREINQQEGQSSSPLVRFKVYKQTTFTIIAFFTWPSCSKDYIQGGGGDLISSSTLKEGGDFDLVTGQSRGMSFITTFTSFVVKYLSFFTCILQQMIPFIGQSCGGTEEFPFKETFPLFEFLCTKTNPHFSINKAALELFHSIRHSLLDLKSQVPL